LFKASTYFREPNGRMSTAYTRQGMGALGSEGFSNHNTFLDQTNLVQLFNVSSSAVSVTVETVDLDGTAVSSVINTIPANSGMNLELEADPAFALLSNTYGYVRVSSSAPSSIIADTVKFRDADAGTFVDFAKGLPIR